MVFLCPRCGNKEKFKQICHGREYFTEIQVLNGNEDYEECDDHETTDSEIDEQEAPFCANCDNNDILKLTEAERIEYLKIRTDKDGVFSEEPLPDKERDDEKYCAMWLIKKF